MGGNEVAQIVARLRLRTELEGDELLLKLCVACWPSQRSQNG